MGGRGTRVREGDVIVKAGEQERKQERARENERERGQCYTAGFEDGGWDHEPRSVEALEAGKV